MSTRKRKTSNGLPTTPTKSPIAPQSLSQQPHHPLLPTPHELLLLAVYPLTLVLGSLLTTLSYLPPGNKATYSTFYQSYQPSSLAPSYFATKSNFLNVYFVKFGWFWVTFALLLFTALASRGRAAIDVGFAAGHARREKVVGKRTVRLSELDETSRRQERDERLRRVYQTAIRYTLITFAWYLTTQSMFLGASLIDTVFSITGGACYALPTSQSATAGVKIPAKSYGACRRAGGRFAGGLDISGHVFLLMLGSGMLFAEVLPVVLPWVSGLTHSRFINHENRTVPVATVTPGVEEQDSGSEAEGPSHGYGTRSAARAKKVIEAQSQTVQKPVTTRLKEYALWVTTAVMLVSWWMLLMTAAFFHSWVEKSAALVVAGSWLWVVYCVPRRVEGVRGLVGLPGV